MLWNNGADWPLVLSLSLSLDFMVLWTLRKEALSKFKLPSSLAELHWHSMLSLPSTTLVIFCSRSVCKGMMSGSILKAMTPMDFPLLTTINFWMNFSPWKSSFSSMNFVSIKFHQHNFIHCKFMKFHGCEHPWNLNFQCKNNNCEWNYTMDEINYKV